MEYGGLWDRQTGKCSFYVPYMELAKTSRSEAGGKPQTSHEKEPENEIDNNRNHCANSRESQFILGIVDEFHI